MTKEREALKLALEAIKELRYSSSTFKFDKLLAEAITAIKEALAQPEHSATYQKINLSLLKHSDNCRFWDEGDLCTCGASEFHELQFWKNKALAQPEMRPDEISTDELIYMNGLYDGMKQERALWEMSKLGQEIEAQPEELVSWGVDWSKDGDIPCVSIIKRLPDGGMEVVAVEYGPPQRPWVGLTDEEVNWFGWHGTSIRTIEAKLKEKNT